MKGSELAKGRKPAKGKEPVKGRPPRAGSPRRAGSPPRAEARARERRDSHRTLRAQPCDFEGPCFCLEEKQATQRTRAETPGRYRHA